MAAISVNSKILETISSDSKTSLDYLRPKNSSNSKKKLNPFLLRSILQHWPSLSEKKYLKEKNSKQVTCIYKCIPNGKNNARISNNPCEQKFKVVCNKL